jgi:hypothetical protein
MYIGAERAKEGEREREREKERSGMQIVHLRSSLKTTGRERGREGERERWRDERVSKKSRREGVRGAPMRKSSVAAEPFGQ